jgi:hypothetical protein
MSKTLAEGRRSQWSYFGFLVWGFVCALVLFIVYPWPDKIRQSKDRVACQTNLTTIWRMMYIHAVEHGTPLSGDEWCDALLAVDEGVKAEKLRCPLSAASEGQCSYALNVAAAGKDPRRLPADMVVLFDSVPGWNQVGGPELLTLDNHRGEGCCVCFADGNVRFVKREQVSELEWTDGKGGPHEPE